MMEWIYSSNFLSSLRNVSIISIKFQTMRLIPGWFDFHEAWIIVDEDANIQLYNVYVFLDKWISINFISGTILRRFYELVMFYRNECTSYRLSQKF